MKWSVQILNTVHSNFFLKKCWLLLFAPGAMLNKLYGWVYFPILWMKKRILWKVKFTWANGLRLSHTKIIYLNYNSMFSALQCFRWFPPPPSNFIMKLRIRGFYQVTKLGFELYSTQIPEVLCSAPCLSTLGIVAFGRSLCM